MVAMLAVVAIVVSVAVASMTYPETRATSQITTDGIQRAAIDQRLAALERRAGLLDARCDRARRFADVTDRRTVWLRAVLHVMANRHGRRLPRGLAVWPVRASAMESIR